MKPAIRTLATLTRTWMMSAFVAAVPAMTGLSGNAQAGVVINLSQVGFDVVMSGSGTLNITDLTSEGPRSGEGEMNPAQAVIILGPANTTSIGSSEGPINGPQSFGSGSGVGASSGSGDFFGTLLSVAGGLDLVAPTGYVSGSTLSATDTYSNATFSSLGLTPGTYTWTWGTGANADFLTVNISTASVPEPSSLVLSGIAVAGGAMAYMWRRRKASGA